MAWRKWLTFTWPSYSLEAHIGLGEMHVEDERFAKYYNERSGIVICKKSFILAQELSLLGILSENILCRINKIVIDLQVNM